MTEYNKRYADRSPESSKKNPNMYLNALAARKYGRYMQMVHGENSMFDRSLPLKMTKNLSNLEEIP